MSSVERADRLYDYETRAIQKGKRKGTLALVAAFSGYFASAFSFFVGGGGGRRRLLGGGRRYGAEWRGRLAMGISVAMIAYRRGLTTHMLARSSFGRVGQVVPSFIVVLTQPAFAALYTRRGRFQRDLASRAVVADQCPPLSCASPLP